MSQGCMKAGKLLFNCGQCYSIYNRLSSVLRTDACSKGPRIQSCQPGLVPMVWSIGSGVNH